MSHRKQRRRFFVDKKVQGELLRKAARYWIISIAVVGSLTVLGWIFITPGVSVLVQIRELLPSVFGVLTVAMVSSLIVLPIILIDLTRMSNRFVGPIYRLRRVMKEAAAGQQVAPIAFRDGDDWQDLAESFNGLLALIQASRSKDDLFDAHSQDSKELVEACNGHRPVGREVPPQFD